LFGLILLGMLVLMFGSSVVIGLYMKNGVLEEM